MSKYKPDHVRVLKALGSDLPERPKLTTEQIINKTFRRCDNADRRVRNAYRMIRAAGHAIIVKRGVYRLTPSGAEYVSILLQAAVTTTGKKKGKKKATKQTIKPRAERPRKKTTKKVVAKARKMKHPIPVVERTLLPDEPPPPPPKKGNHAPKKPADASASLSF